MKACVVYGQSHKGSTYHIARSSAERLTQEIHEVFLPRDFHDFCLGFTTCFIKGAAKLAPIEDANDARYIRK